MLEEKEERIFYRQAVGPLFDVYDQQLVGKYTENIQNMLWQLELLLFNKI